ncbi:MAG: hypothetical protein JW759_09535 [Candidatus Coatesbacteria bacterium]|nr:hypothetical protein [Candidatus Coatesbacteria bacterium]
MTHADAPTKSVLVVGNDSDFRATLAESIENLGYLPVEVENTEQATAVLGLAKIDILLWDVCDSQPRANPVFMQWLEHVDPSIPVVCLVDSCCNVEGSAWASRAPRRVQVLTKPVSMNALSSGITAMLRPEAGRLGE